MLIDPSRALPEIERNQRLFIAVGEPWNEALQSIKEPSGSMPFKWDIWKTYKAGDWILTYLATRPRVFLCWEQSTRDATEGGKIWVDVDTAVYFDNIITVDDVEKDVGIKITPRSRFDERQAVDIRMAILRRFYSLTPWHGLGRHIGENGVEDVTICY
ncbi:hypothetical protein ACNHUS_18800 [Actinomycetes bacterium M1A6_2h]